MAKLIDPNKLVSLPEVASDYGYNPNYLGTLAKEGKLEAWYVGGCWITTRENIEAYTRKAGSPGRPRGKRRKS